MIDKYIIRYFGNFYEDNHYAIMHYRDAVGGWVDVATNDDWLEANYICTKLNEAAEAQEKIDKLVEYIRDECIENHNSLYQACVKCSNIFLEIDLNVNDI